MEVSVFVRNPAKFEGMDISGVNIIQGAALKIEDVKRGMEGQDILLCSLEGDVLSMARNIVATLESTSVKRIIWITGMGIHHEIKDGNNTKYFLTKEGEQPSRKNIDRAGIAQCMADMIHNEQLGVNESLGITN